jgi:RND superfamily putative drug exporter
MKGNLAARAGAWSAAHWKTATVGWLVLVVAAVVLGAVAGTKTLTDVEDSQGETLARSGSSPTQASETSPARA